MFTGEHLNEVRKLDRFLYVHCDTGVSRDDEKFLCYSIFDMWLVRNRISNLIYLSRLEKDEFYVTYYTRKPWVVHFLDGTPIFFKRDNGLFDLLPYVGLEYLMTIKCESVAMLQTVWGYFDVFTRR